EGTSLAGTNRPGVTAAPGASLRHGVAVSGRPPPGAILVLGPQEARSDLRIARRPRPPPALILALLAVAGLPGSGRSEGATPALQLLAPLSPARTAPPSPALARYEALHAAASGAQADARDRTAELRDPLPWRWIVRDRLPAWRALPAPSLQRPTAVLDASRNRILAFAPDLYAEDPGQERLWSLPLDGSAGWSEVIASGPTQFPRGGFTAVLDTHRDRILVFGGAHALPEPFHPIALFNDVWELTLSGRPTWSQLAVAGDPPSPRSDYAAIYDPVKDAVVVFGG